MPQPTLVVVTGPAGSGKTTLAHELARAIPCPAICRDEIKEGMVHAAGEFEAAMGDALTRRTFPLFFAVIRRLLEDGVTLVADAAFQDHVWRPQLEPLKQIARLRVVQCHVDAAVARERVLHRGVRRAHADAQFLADSEALYATYKRLTMDEPSIDVDTSKEYSPPLAEIVAFVNTPSSARPTTTM